jgi:hypothetical protein
MVTKLIGKLVNFDCTLKMKRILKKLKQKNGYVEDYFEKNCIMAMRDDFLRDIKEEIMKFVHGMKISINMNIITYKM